MASKREQILDAVITSLGAVGKPAGLVVDRYRTRPYQQSGLPAVAVYPFGETITGGDGRHGYKVIRSFVLRCEVRAATTSPSTSVDELLDPILSWVVRRVMLDRQQGGLAHNTSERATQWAAEEADAIYGAASVDFTIDYVTAAGDPDA